MFKHVPNILSCVRLLLIPVFLYAYLGKEMVWVSFLIMLLSGITDILDGYLARKYSLITPLGKVLDPIADKLTVLCVTFAIAYRGFEWMWLVFYILLFKELLLIAGGILLYRKKDIVSSSRWYGKLATVLLHISIYFGILLGDHLWIKICLLAAALISVGAGIAYVITYISLVSREKTEKNKEI